MPLVGPATAEGDLQRTPLAHLLVYAVDHRLSGAMLLTDPAGVEHVIRLERGVPVKVWAGDGYAMFGELLVEDGHVSPQTLEKALATKGVLGDVLLLSGCVDAATLDWVAEIQLVKRMVHLFELPADTTYRYFDRDEALGDWGCEPVRMDPLALLWAGLRDHGECSSRLLPMLERLGEAPLRLHAASELGRFGFRRAEIAAVERMRADAPSLAELVGSGVAPEAMLRKVVYALLITRSIDLGAGSPVGVENVGRPLADAPGQAVGAVGKLQLRSVVYRVGAAAPDPSGDGERAPVSPRVRRKKESDSPPSEQAGGGAGGGAGEDSTRGGGGSVPPEADGGAGARSDRTPRIDEAEGFPSSSLRRAGPPPVHEDRRSPVSRR